MITLPPILNGEDKSCPLLNCIRNNYRHAKKWAKRTNTNCFRIYDREISSFPLAIDFYDQRYCVHYFNRREENEDELNNLQTYVNNVLIKLLGTLPEMIFWRLRQKTKETRQYEKRDNKREFFTVMEYGVKFLINLTDYLDTGLFLDHRESRQIVSSLCKDKNVLNLFAYTCSFSVHAAIKGAKSTKSIDMSNSYTRWGADNFLLNSISMNNHEIIRADCLKFLESESHTNNKFDVIFIDPPTISRSKKMEQLFDIQEDYSFILQKSLSLLNKGGVIFFSTNSRKFRLDESLFPDCKITNTTKKTIPFDFHEKKIHQSWFITIPS